MNYARTIRVMNLLIIAMLSCTGCAQRRYTQARSEVLADANRKGISSASITSEREQFLAFEQRQQERIKALLSKRTKSAGQNSNYKIGPGDEIEISVFDVPELDKTVRVRQSGLMSLPLIGAVQAGGLTESELKRSLTERLRRFVHAPEVMVFISTFGSQKVAVLGAVAQPGTYPLKKGSNSILEVIGEAGGLTKAAGSYLTLVPGDVSGLDRSGVPEDRARLALASMTNADLRDSAIEVPIQQVYGTGGGIPLEIPIHPGDMIVVPDAGKVTVEGEVERRGSYELGSRSTLLGALAAAGGITYGANVDEVEVIRDFGDEGQIHLVLDLEKVARGEMRDVSLKDGDIVRVPSHTGRRLSQDTFDGISRLINFGIGGSFSVAP